MLEIGAVGLHARDKGHFQFEWNGVYVFQSVRDGFRGWVTGLGVGFLKFQQQFHAVVGFDVYVPLWLLFYTNVKTRITYQKGFATIFEFSYSLMLVDVCAFSSEVPFWFTFVPPAPMDHSGLRLCRRLQRTK